MLSTRVENLVEKMTNEAVDDRFSSGLIGQCCQILSIPVASGSEDSDIDEGSASRCSRRSRNSLVSATTGTLFTASLVKVTISSKLYFLI